MHYRFYRAFALIALLTIAGCGGSETSYRRSHTYPLEPAGSRVTAQPAGERAPIVTIAPAGERAPVVAAAPAGELAPVTRERGCGRDPSDSRIRPCLAGPASVVIGRPGDRWLDTMDLAKVERSSRGDVVGYQAIYRTLGDTTITFFWSKHEIDFQDTAPKRYRIRRMPLGRGQLYYPTRVTRESLPRVHELILVIEAHALRQISGGIAAAGGFADIASLGAGLPVARAAGAAATTSRMPAARVVSGQAAKKAAKQAFKPLTAANFRENLGKLTGGIPKGVEAHHVFPQKFAERFQKLGINIHDPRYGAWWQTAAHRRNAAAYNDQWFQLIGPGKPLPTVEQVFQLARALADEYGLTIYL